MELKQKKEDSHHSTKNKKELNPMKVDINEYYDYETNKNKG